MALKKSQKSLKDWTDQDWSTKSGKKSSETGERYLPKSAIDSLSSQEYAATTKKKREDTKKGKQHSKQPKKIAKKTAQHRYKGGLMQEGKGVSDKETELFSKFEKAMREAEAREEAGVDESFSEMYSRLEEETGGEAMMPSYMYDLPSYEDLEDAQEKNEGGLVSDTSPRMKRAREAREERQALGVPEDTTVQDAAYFAASLAPVTGEAIAAKEAAESFEQGDYGEAAFLAAGAIPGLGFIPRAAGKALRKAKVKLGKIPEGGLDASDFADDEFEDLLKSVSDKDKKRKTKIEAGLEKNRMAKEEMDAFISRQPTSTEISDAMARNELPMGTAYDVKDQTTVWAEHWKKADPLDIGFDEDLFTAPASASKTSDYFYNGLSSVEDNFANATFGKGNMDDVFRNKPVEKNTKTSLRLNLNSKIPNVDKGLSKATTVHFDKPSGPVASYVATGTVDDAVFEVNQKGRALISSKVDNKFPAMGVTGKWNPDETVFDAASKRDLVGKYAGEKGDPLDVIEIKFNPFSDHLFKDARTGWAVKSAEKATTIGDRVFAIGVKYHSKADAPKALEKVSKTKKGEKIEGTPPPSTVRFPFNKGGFMYGNKEYKKMHGGGHAKKDYSKYKKMNMGGYTGGMTQAMGMNPMFDETEEMPQMNCGGYMGGGMMSADVIVGIDPVSGNEIPLGSDAENVRDDIPAMLSEDEYVLPADVVKWHGLKHIQEMHDEASMGLMSMAMDGLVATGEPAVKSKDAEKVKQEYRTEKGSRKTPEGVEVELTAYEVEDKADLEKEDDSKYKSKVKGNMKEYGKGGLLGYAEGGLVDDEDPDPYGDLLDDGFEFDADMMNAEMLEEVAAEQRARDKELEPYIREESLTEEDAVDLFDVDEEAGVVDVPDGGLDTTPVSEDEEISEDKVNKVAAALLKQANSYGGSGSEGAAFMSGLGNGVKMAELGKKVGDQLADYETKSGNNPFGFLRDDKGFFRKRD